MSFEQKEDYLSGQVIALEHALKMARETLKIATLHYTREAACNEELKLKSVEANIYNRNLRNEVRVLHIKLRAANKGAERNAHKAYKIFNDCLEAVLDNPYHSEIQQAFERIQKKYNL